MINLLVDADIPAYMIAARSESVYDFEGDGSDLAIELSPENIGPMVEEELTQYADAVGADHIYACMSAPGGHYFRNELEPTYKGKRKGTRKPELLQAVKNYMAAEYPYFVRPRLEADDVMGILATHPCLLPGTNVICSADKDMRTIPGKLYNPNKPTLGVLDISEWDADRFLLYQTIVGDATDCYPGAPGVGDGGKWENSGFVAGARSIPYAYDVIFAETPEEGWDIVVEAYASVGLSEDDAIHQARLARILRAEDYNFKTQKIKLWNPTKLYWNQ